jgi:hypothetical protein
MRGVDKAGKGRGDLPLRSMWDVHIVPALVLILQPKGMSDSGCK